MCEREFATLNRLVKVRTLIGPVRNCITDGGSQANRTQNLKCPIQRGYKCYQALVPQTGEFEQPRKEFVQW